MVIFVRGRLFSLTLTKPTLEVVLFFFRIKVDSPVTENSRGFGGGVVDAFLNNEIFPPKVGQTNLNKITTLLEENLVLVTQHLHGFNLIMEITCTSCVIHFNGCDQQGFAVPKRQVLSHRQ